MLGVVKLLVGRLCGVDSGSGVLDVEGIVLRVWKPPRKSRNGGLGILVMRV